MLLIELFNIYKIINVKIELTYILITEKTSFFVVFIFARKYKLLLSNIHVTADDIVVARHSPIMPNLFTVNKFIKRYVMPCKSNTNK